MALVAFLTIQRKCLDFAYNLQYSKHTDQQSVKRSVSHAAQQIPGADRRKNPKRRRRALCGKGYAHTTLQDIIDATGLSKGAVYHHFQSKEEIAARVGDRLGTQVTGELARIRDDASLTGLQKLQAVFAVCLVPQRQQTLQRALPRLWDDPQFLSIELHDLLEKTIPLYLEPMVRQGTADGSIHTPDPDALCEALFLLADLWLNPQTRPTTPARQRARCAVFQQLTQALGLDLLTDEQAEELAALCEAE